MVIKSVLCSQTLYPGAKAWLQLLLFGQVTCSQHLDFFISKNRSKSGCCRLRERRAVTGLLGADRAAPRPEQRSARLATVLRGSETRVASTGSQASAPCLSFASDLLEASTFLFPLSCRFLKPRGCWAEPEPLGGHAAVLRGRRSGPDGG